jgi:hypothetical protein
MMSLDYIRKTYGVPAKRGARVEYSGGKSPLFGTITGSRSAYIRVRLDGDKTSKPFHPTWEIRYLDDATSNNGEAKS